MAITLVQHASSTAQFTSGTSGTITATFASNATSGNCLVACFSGFARSASFSLTVSSVTTNGTAENWAVAASATTSAHAPAWIYADPNTGGGQNAINVNISFGATATSAAGVSACLDIYEVSGIIAVSPVDKTHTGGSTSVTSWSSGTTATTTSAVEFWVGVAGLSVIVASTTETVTGPSSPWSNQSLLHTTVPFSSSPFNVYQLSGSQITASTGTATYSGTNSVSSDYNAAVVTLTGTTNVSLSLSVAQVTIAAPAPTVVVTPQLAVAQVNINARALTLGAGPIALSVAQVNINARTPGVSAGPISLPVAQVNISAPAPGLRAGPVSLSAAQVSVNALPFILGKSFAITCAQVTITAYPPGISRPGEQEDTIVPLMITGVYSNV